MKNTTTYLARIASTYGRDDAKGTHAHTRAMNDSLLCAINISDDEKSSLLYNELGA